MARVHIITKILMDEAERLCNKEVEMNIWNNIIARIGLKPMGNIAETMNQLGGD